MRRTFVWRGLDAVRLELAEAEGDSDRFTARGTQIGVEPGAYELICLPLRVVGADGAPARTVLVRDE